MEVITIIKTLNINRQTTAILENAYNIGYELTENILWTAHFSLPLNDPKVSKVELLRYVEITDNGRYIGLFRVMPKKTTRNESTQEVSFECEHVLGTLINKYLIGYHQMTNYTTKHVIQYLLNQQHQKHWKLGTVAFTRYFHYSWENENLLSALLSIPKPFDQQYRWTFDTTSYPWTLNLVGVEDKPTARIRDKHNLVGLEIVEDPTPVFNRIIPFGAGEGVNKLTIRDVNNGIPYLDKRNADDEIIEYIWADDRFKDPQALKDSAQALLNDQYKAKASWKATAADVSKITGTKVDELRIGKVVRIDVDDMPTIDMRILKEKRSDITGDPGKATLEMGTLRQDLGTTQADMQRRQRINELYSMGATNILPIPAQDNADSNNPLRMLLVIDDDVVNVNTFELWFEALKFRAYSKATGGGGALVKSTKGGGANTITSGGGGGTTATSGGGGGTSKSTSSGGGTQKTSGAGGDHVHVVFTQTSQQGPFDLNTFEAADGSLLQLESASNSLTTKGSSGNHTHNITLTAHTHEITLEPHTHSITLTNHTHQITIAAHTHEIELPNHTHEIIHGIYLLEETASNVEVRVDGNLVSFSGTNADRLDIIDYLDKDSNGKIRRGKHEVTLLPNRRARIEAQAVARIFIQSQLGVSL